MFFCQWRNLPVANKTVTHTPTKLTVNHLIPCYVYNFEYSILIFWYESHLLITRCLYLLTSKKLSLEWNQFTKAIYNAWCDCPVINLQIHFKPIWLSIPFYSRQRTRKSWFGNSLLDYCLDSSFFFYKS